MHGVGCGSVYSPPTLVLEIVMFLSHWLLPSGFGMLVPLTNRGGLYYIPSRLRWELGSHVIFTRGFACLSGPGNPLSSPCDVNPALEPEKLCSSVFHTYVATGSTSITRITMFLVNLFILFFLIINNILY